MRTLLAIAVSTVAAGVFAFEDEPDELNWDTLGGTVVGFTHFREYCESHSDFRERLMAGPPLADLPVEPVTVWIGPDDFTNAVVKMWWGQGEVDGVKVLTCNAGHDAVSGSTRIGIDIPRTGLYRVWAKYWHEQGGAASFGLELSDGRFADSPDLSLQTIEDVFYHRFDFVEYVRRSNPLPDRREEPSGWVWESTPLVRLDGGRKSLTVSGIIHEGPYNPRRIAAIVITEEPVATPDGDGPKMDEVRELWARRPQITEGSARFRPLWREWKRAFIADLAEGRVAGVDAGRMAGTVYYDEDTNFVGTPRQVADAKAAAKRFFLSLDRSRFMKKIEAESFTLGREGWEEETIVGTSNGRVLRASYGGWECDAYADFSVPSNGTYAVWVRYMEVGEFLAPFKLFVEKPTGGTIAEKPLADNNDNGHRYGGWIWEKVQVTLDSPDVRLRLYKLDSGKAYRRVDGFVVTDDLAYAPEGIGIVVPPLDNARPLTVWRLEEMWYGYDRLTAPKPGEGLSPYRVTLREGEVESIQLLVRNNTGTTLEATPKIGGDLGGIVRWRVPAYVYVGGDSWCAMPLFEREDLFVPPEETTGIWLTVDGRKPFTGGRAEVTVGGEMFVIEVEKLDPLPPGTPVPYVLGWATPYRTVSSWEFFRDYGINVICDSAIPKAEVAKYGVKLNLHLNDENVSEEHMKYLIERYKTLGYDYDEWAWSFMDEPPADQVDKWIACAETLREFDPDVKIWVNPGEGSIDCPPACINMMPYANYYCPAGTHFFTDGWRNPVYNDMLHREDPDVNIELLLTYGTPCFTEKSPAAPLDLLGMYGAALAYNLDGYAFFALAHGFTYSNSVWDEVNAYYGDQCINVYPGAAGRTLSTRNAEALLECRRRFMKAKADIR